VERPVWTGRSAPAEPIECLVQLRAHGEIHPCRAWPDDGTLKISLLEPARGVAAGQAAVLYDGDTVLGSGTIASTAALAGSAA
ncbi:MAG TPA: aminomethyltransferase beta-barrel domain-containing protein, partial [Trebonia sp.]|nr:aminomethyltransferase beta-barrel domain-containing protein [Trebonia sp.]